MGKLTSPTAPQPGYGAQTSAEGVNLRTSPGRSSASDGGTIKQPMGAPSPDRNGTPMGNKSPRGI